MSKKTKSCKNKRKYPGQIAHLHTHNDGSDGLATTEEGLKKVKCEYICITNHNHMHQALEFYKIAKKAGKKPILGCEVYMEDINLQFDKDLDIEELSGKKRGRNHLVLIAKNKEGLKNLYKIVSKAQKNQVQLFGDKKASVVKYTVLKEHAKGIICLSGCIAAEIPKLLLAGEDDKALKVAKRLKKIFKDDFYLEIQRHGLEKEETVNPGLIELSEKVNVKMVATFDSHYIDKNDKKFHAALQKKKDKKNPMIKTLEDAMLPGEYYYLVSPKKAEEIFFDMPDALDNTIEIAKKCEEDIVEFPDKLEDYNYPKFPVPDGYTEDSYLRELTYKGFKKQFKNEPHKLKDPRYKERLEYELKKIEKIGFSSYFLLIQDVVNYAEDNGILMGAARGSAASSLVCRALGITKLIDPVEENLLFERFLNTDRKSAPDVDLDFCSLRRDELFDYVREKYGNDRVAQIVTFNKDGIKGAIATSTIAQEYEYELRIKISKLIPDRAKTVEEALELSSELKELYESDERVKSTLDIAKGLIGNIVSNSSHAAGVVIAPDSLDNYLPISIENKDGKSKTLTQYNMNEVESLGLLKADFLAIETITSLRFALESINKDNENLNLTIDTIPLYDDNVYKEIFAKAKTGCVFQCESSGMRKFLKRLFTEAIKLDISGKKLFDLLAQAISLYRPGPMEHIDEFIENMKNPENIKYPHKSIKHILEPTYGIILYQEQVMQIAQILAGYSLGQADDLRRAMGKKKKDIMKENEEYFIYGKKDEDGNIEIPGCINMGIKEKTAKKIYEQIYTFCAYAFNKSHGVAYAVLAAQTAYLKAYYPVQFLEGNFNAAILNGSKITKPLAACMESDIKLLQPDVNKSQDLFRRTVKGNIRFGLAGIKSVGHKASEKLIEERIKNGLFKSYEDFLYRTFSKERGRPAICSIKILEPLIYSGALDRFECSRKAKIDAGENAVTRSINLYKARNNKEFNDILGLYEDEEIEEEFIEDCSEYNAIVKYVNEVEYCGAYLSGDINKSFDEIFDYFRLDKIIDIRRKLDCVDENEYEDRDNDEDIHENNLEDSGNMQVNEIDLDNAKILAYLTEVEIKTRNDNGQEFITFKVTDFSGPESSTIISGATNIKHKETLIKGTLCIIKGRVYKDKKYGPKITDISVNKLILPSDEVPKAKDINVCDKPQIIAVFENEREIDKKVFELKDAKLNSKNANCNIHFVSAEDKKIYKSRQKYKITDDILNIVVDGSLATTIR